MGAPRSSPRKPDDEHFAVLGLGLCFGQAAPGDFGIGKDDRRNGQIVERGQFARQRFCHDLGFARRLVGQHRFACDVSDRKNRRVGRAALRVDHHEALGIGLDLGLFETQVLAVRTAADRNQDAVEFLFGRLAVLADQTGCYSRFLDVEVFDFRGKMNRLKQPFQPLLQWPDQFTIGPRQKPRQHFDDDHFGTDRCIDRAHFEADVTAADHEQPFGNVFQRKRPGRIHDPRVVLLEDGGDGRRRTGCQNRVFEF